MFRALLGGSMPGPSSEEPHPRHRTCCKKELSPVTHRHPESFVQNSITPSRKAACVTSTGCSIAPRICQAERLLGKTHLPWPGEGAGWTEICWNCFLFLVINSTDLGGKDVYVTVPATAPASACLDQPLSQLGADEGERCSEEPSAAQAGRRCALPQSPGAEAAQPGACPNCWECLQLMRTV